MKILDGLTEEQQNAVTHAQGPLIIIAGAGTGKTKVITTRIAWLIEQKLAKPSEIVALTFTEKAANEMSDRLETLVGHHAIEISTTTFHGFCQQIIGRYGLEIGITPGAPLLNEIQLWLLLTREFDRLNLKHYKPHGNPTKFLRSIIKHIARAKDENITVEQYAAYAEKIRLDAGEIDGPESEEVRRVSELAECYRVYQELLLERGVMDFGDLLLYANQILVQRPSVRAKMQQRIKYVVVDEFQDTNMAQYDLVRALLGPEQNITVVGDDDQAIYKFRGASVDNILQFRAHFPTRAEVFLTKNYRSKQEILDASYALIQRNNPYRLESDELGVSSGAKKLTAARGDGAVVTARSFATGIKEAKWIATDIERAIIGGAAPRAIAVLTRGASHIEEVAGELRRRGIPYVIAQTEGLLKTSAALDLMSLLRAALERYNTNAWYHVSISRISHISPHDLVECIAYARRKNISLARVLHGEYPSELSDDGNAAIKDLIARLKLTPEILHTNKASTILYSVLEATDYFRALVRSIESGDTAAMQDMTLVNSFLEFIAEWEAQHPRATPYDFLADCDRLLEFGEEAGQAGALIDVDAVQMLTIHSAKGLEFSRVYVVSAVEQRLPSTERREGIELPDALVREHSIPDDHHTQEERRLAYVAFTRAQDVLTISYAEKYGGSETARRRKPSRFISEAGIEIIPATEELTEEVSETPPNLAMGVTFFEGAIAPREKAPLSFSQLQMFEKCPYQYWFAHVLRLPRQAKWSMSFGKSIHSALQKWYELLKEEDGAEQVALFETNASHVVKKVPEVAKLLELLTHAWINEGYPSEKFHDEKFADAEKMLRLYYRQNEHSWNIPAHIEKKFRVIIGGETLEGSIDRIDINSDGSIEIIDYKTSAPKTSDDLKFQDKEQLLIYQIAAERDLEFRPTLLSYYYVQDGTRATFSAKAKDLEKIETFVAETGARIREGKFEAKPSSFTCAQCDFKDICEYRDL